MLELSNYDMLYNNLWDDIVPYIRRRSGSVASRPIPMGDEQREQDLDVYHAPELPELAQVQAP